MKFLQNITPRDYQNNIVDSCKDKNSLVVLPTGVGKTLIALMLTIFRLEQIPSGKVLFLAPTKPLVEQHLNYYKKHLPELFADMQMFTGSVKPEERKKIWQSADIIFSTPQCISNDLKNRLYDLKEVILLIEDEAHRCLKNYAYREVAQNYINSAKSPRILGLTASPGSDSDKIKEICKNLSVEALEVRTRKSEDVKEFLQELKFDKITLDFPEEFEQIRIPLRKIYNEYVEELRGRRVLFGNTSKIALIELQRKLMASLARGNKNFSLFHSVSACSQAIKIQHALELLETQTLLGFHNYMKKLYGEASQAKSKGVQKLVKNPEFNISFIRSQELLTKNIEHPKLEKLKEIVKEEIDNNESVKIIIFTQFRETALHIIERLNELEKVNAKVFVGQTKKSHNSYSLKSKDKEQITGLNQKAQQQMIKEFSEGRVNVLCATSIGEEGLDIPEVNAVIFYEPVPSAIRKIQRAGRTARLIPGKLITLVTKNTRDEAYYWAAFSREKKMYSAIASIQEEMENGKFNSLTENNKQKSLEEF